MSQKELLETNIAKHGIIHQKVKAIEECAELIQAIAKDNDPANIAEEIADVEIMLEQLKIIYSNEKQVEGFKLKKLSRIENNLYGIEVI